MVLMYGTKMARLDFHRHATHATQVVTRSCSERLQHDEQPFKEGGKLAQNGQSWIRILSLKGGRQKVKHEILALVLFVLA